MQKGFILVALMVFSIFTNAFSQQPISGKKVKTITEYNIDNKQKELDHVINFDANGLKIDEVEYYADGLIKTKTIFEYDSDKKCVKSTKYGQKGKIEKVTTYQYDAEGEINLESSFYPEKRYKTDKVFEYSYY